METSREDPSETLLARFEGRGPSWRSGELLCWEYQLFPNKTRPGATGISILKEGPEELAWRFSLRREK